jgi:hypothetical protein
MGLQFDLSKGNSEDAEMDHAEENICYWEQELTDVMCNFIISILDLSWGD